MQTKIKIRKSWGQVHPAQFAHSSKKGKKGYSRKDNKRMAREAY
jgi:hypothetical protein